MNALNEHTSLEVVTFTLVEQQYALPLNQVREVIPFQEITPLPKVPSFTEGVISLRGRVLAVVNLRKRLDLPLKDVRQSRIMIVRLPKVLIGLVIDTAEDVLTLSPETVQDTLDAMPIHLDRQYFVGIARVKSRLIVLLNLQTIFSEDEVQQLEQWRKRSL